MERRDSYVRKLGTIVECLEELPPAPAELNALERKGVLHLVQVATDAAMDVAAMLTKDHGRTVQDDYHNLQSLQDLGVLDPTLAEQLRTLNGLRNAIVHKYNKFEEATVFEGLPAIQEQLLAFVRTVDGTLEVSG